MEEKIKLVFKDIIKKLRQERGLSQQELAQKTGLSASSIGMYEQGRRKPSFEVLQLFADTFNVDIDYLLGRSVEPNKYLTILIRAQKELSEEDLKSLEDMAEYLLYRNKRRKSEKRKNLEIKDILIERMKSTMEKLDISAAELSRRTGIRSSSISDYLTGKYAPKQDKIDLIAEALGVSPVWLMGWEDENGLKIPLQIID